MERADCLGIVSRRVKAAPGGAVVLRVRPRIWTRREA